MTTFAVLVMFMLILGGDLSNKLKQDPWNISKYFSLIGIPVNVTNTFMLSFLNKTRSGLQENYNSLFLSCSPDHLIVYKIISTCKKSRVITFL